MLENMLKEAAKSAIKHHAHKSVDEFIDKAEKLIISSKVEELTTSSKPVEIIKQNPTQSYQKRKIISKIGVISSSIISVCSIIGLVYYVHNTKFEHKDVNVPGVAVKMLLLELL
jgi:hypothetical protein